MSPARDRAIHDRSKRRSHTRRIRVALQSRPKLMNPSYAPDQTASSATLGAFDVLRLVLLRRRWLILVPFLAGAAVVVAGLFGKRSWTSSAAMIAHASGANVSRL